MLPKERPQSRMSMCFASLDCSSCELQRGVPMRGVYSVQRLWRFGGSPQRAASRQLSIGTPGSNVLDTRLLQQLKLACALRPAALLSLTADGSLKDMPVQV